MIRFAGMVSPTNVSFTGIDGKNHVISTGHPNNERIRQLMRETQAAFRDGDEVNGRRLWQELTDCTDIPKALHTVSGGKVSVRDGEVYYGEDVLHNAVTRRILWAMQEGYDAQPHMHFLENLLENPSKRAVDETFEFLDACNMGITEDGYIIAYKRVRPDYTDHYSGTFDNSVGQKHEMPRNKVDEDKHRTCSDGFHFCSFSYLPEFGAGGTTLSDRVVILKIHPRDVVAIPADYNNAKARCCAYEVIGEYQGSDLSDVLSRKPVWTRDDVRSDFGNENYGADEETRLERFVSILHDNDNGSLDSIDDIEEDTTLGDLPFYIRSQLMRIIEEEYPSAGFVDHDTVSDDYLTIGELLDIIDDSSEGLHDSDADDMHDTDTFDSEGAVDEVEQNDSGAVPIFGAGASPAAGANSGAVTGAASGQTTVFIRPEQKGADTRWVAECPSCNEGQGWSQTYARKRDARRGIRRVLGDNVAIVERS